MDTNEESADKVVPTTTNESCPKCGEILVVYDYDNGASFYCEKCGFLDEYGSP